jgi:hypothetical protein
MQRRLFQSICTQFHVCIALSYQALRHFQSPILTGEMQCRLSGICYRRPASLQIYFCLAISNQALDHFQGPSRLVQRNAVYPFFSLRFTLALASRTKYWTTSKCPFRLAQCNAVCRSVFTAFTPLYRTYFLTPSKSPIPAASARDVMLGTTNSETPHQIARPRAVTQSPSPRKRLRMEDSYARRCSCCHRWSASSGCDTRRSIARTARSLFRSQAENRQMRLESSGVVSFTTRVLILYVVLVSISPHSSWSP